MTFDAEFSLKAALRAILFASGQPVELQKLCMFFEKDAPTLTEILDSIKQELDSPDSGVMLSVTDDGVYRLCTKPEYGDIVANYLSQRRTQGLSNAAMEVLAVTAYNNPVTKTYISQIRGVNSAEIVDNLVEKDLLEPAGRLDLPGRPMSYRTTSKFLTVFGLDSLESLPPIESFLNPDREAESVDKPEETPAAESPMQDVSGQALPGEEG